MSGCVRDNDISIVCKALPRSAARKMCKPTGSEDDDDQECGLLCDRDVYPLAIYAWDYGSYLLTFPDSSLALFPNQVAWRPCHRARWYRPGLLHPVVRIHRQYLEATGYLSVDTGIQRRFRLRQCISPLGRCLLCQILPCSSQHLLRKDVYLTQLSSTHVASLFQVFQSCKTKAKSNSAMQNSWSFSIINQINWKLIFLVINHRRCTLVSLPKISPKMYWTKLGMHNFAWITSSSKNLL